MKSLNIYKIISWMLSSVVVLIFLWHGTTLLFATPGSHTYAYFASYDLTTWMIPMGLWELLVGALFLIPRTSRVGYLLAMIHWGGMFFLQLSQGQPIALILYLMVLATGVNYIRNPRMLKQINIKNDLQKSTKKYKQVWNQIEN